MHYYSDAFLSLLFICYKVQMSSCSGARARITSNHIPGFKCKVIFKVQGWFTHTSSLYHSITTPLDLKTTWSLHLTLCFEAFLSNIWGMSYRSAGWFWHVWNFNGHWNLGPNKSNNMTQHKLIYILLLFYRQKLREKKDGVVLLLAALVDRANVFIFAKCVTALKFLWPNVASSHGLNWQKVVIRPPLVCRSSDATTVRSV